MCCGTMEVDEERFQVGIFQNVCPLCFLAFCKEMWRHKACPTRLGEGQAISSPGLAWFSYQRERNLALQRQPGKTAPPPTAPPPAQDLVMPAIQEIFGVRGSFRGGGGAPRTQLEEPLLGSASFGAPKLVPNDIGYPHWGGEGLPKPLPHNWKPGAGCLQIQ